MEPKTLSEAELVEEIRKYESDTFNARAAGLTKEESLELARELIKVWSLRMDGVTLNELALNLRADRGQLCEICEELNALDVKRTRYKFGVDGDEHTDPMCFACRDSAHDGSGDPDAPIILEVYIN